MSARNQSRITRNEMNWRKLVLITVVVFVGLLCMSTGARADFGLAPGSVSVRLSNANGTLDTLAGSHPYAFSVSFELNKKPNGHTEGGVMRNAIVKLPPGFVGDPRSIPECPQQKFEIEQCPVETQIGVLHTVIVGNEEGVGGISPTGPVYNLVPPPGSAAELGFNADEFLSRQ